ncbi:beta-2-glycoprotein 1-like [Leuresthes tenuis]|uniref:beta-2-glycoprotein 1-like n=1 Tax=Leuresthes tenuis TaxID=355514 RepID=UPI003B510FCD
MEGFITLFLLCSGLLFTPGTSEQDNGCLRPELTGNIEIAELQRFFGPGVEVALSCKQGYTPVSSPRKIVCTATGEWTKTRLKCIPKQCPSPDPLPSGELYYEDTVYQSTINYTCNEGYVMIGSSSAVCQASGTWSTPLPECRPVSCGLAPIPEFGIVVYDKSIRGNTTDYGLTATYACLPPYAVFGNPTAECTASGTWTQTPICQVVTCPPPENIERGYMSSSDQREYDFMEKVRYGCEDNYELEGIFEIVCQQNGNWSEKPSCKAPCEVGIQRAKILYKGRKIGIKDLPSNVILHKEIVSVYCKNEDRKCGYAVPTQCIDGTLKIPECFKEPSVLKSTFDLSSLPSEIEKC